MKFTPERREIILKAIGDGLTQKDGAALAGIDETTLIRWKHADADFANQLQQKEIELKNSMIQVVRRATSRQWTAAAWWLERKHKNEFALKTELEHSGELAMPILGGKSVHSDNGNQPDSQSQETN